MATSGQLKSKVDRFKKKIVEKGAALGAGKKRILAKKLKRFQRARRTALVLEKRAEAEKARGAKVPGKTQGDQQAPGGKPIGDKPVREKPIGDKPPGEEGAPTEEKVSGAKEEVQA